MMLYGRNFMLLSFSYHLMKQIRSCKTNEAVGKEFEVRSCGW